MLRFLLDEHLRGPLWLAIVRHNLQGGLPIDALRVRDSPDLPLGSDDPTILLWAEREGRLLLTEDVHTMPTHLSQHLQAGRHSPKVFVIAAGYTIGQLLNSLELIAHAGDAADYSDTLTYVP